MRAEALKQRLFHAIDLATDLGSVTDIDRKTGVITESVGLTVRRS